MQERYEAAAVERAAQEFWDNERVFEARENAGDESGKFYCLSMFPYPSGRLHMGHVRNYTIGDVLTRFAKMQGKSVLQPMGWDAFGLPAENAAIKNNVPPAKWTRDNIAYMKAQLKSLGFAFDWSREIATCDPSYYRWNQWLFLRMLEKGIAYRKTGVVNWDPVDQTVLANEQVIDGRGWRTGAIVEKREIPMYYLGITKYADELLGDLEKLPDWPERVKTMQANWIGKSEGCEISFPYSHRTPRRSWAPTARSRCSPRAPTPCSACTFMAIAAEHPDRAGGGRAGIRRCRRSSTSAAAAARWKPTSPRRKRRACAPACTCCIRSRASWSKSGWPTTCSWPTAKAPSWACRRTTRATTSSRSRTSWPSCQVIKSKTGAYDERGSRPGMTRTPNTASRVNSGEFDGLEFQAAVDAIAAALEKKGLGRKRTQWRLRDWGISRQRYWGCPVPLIHCAKCGVVPVPDDQLPVVLPEGLVPDGSGNPLNKTPSFLRMQVSRSAARMRGARRTPWTPSWIRPGISCASRAPTRTPWWTSALTTGCPVDQYIGGIEHAILHLLYSRFWTKVMRDMKLVGNRRALRQPADAGHGAAPHLLPRARAGPPRLLQSGRRRSAVRRHQPAHGRHPAHRQQAGGLGRARHDVQVQEQRRGSHGAGRAVRRRHGAHVHDVHRASRADAGVVGRGRAGLVPFHSPTVEGGVRPGECAAARGCRSPRTSSTRRS